MKYTFERTTFLMIFAILISIGSLACNNQSPPPLPTTSPTQQQVSPTQQWVDWVNLQKRIGRTVLDATESRLWLEEHSGKISLPDKIGFMEQHLVIDPSFIGIIITTDHTGKRRIIARQWPLPEPPKAPILNNLYAETHKPPKAPILNNLYAETHTLLSHSESLNWLRRNGYSVSATGNGYRIILNIPGYHGNFSIEDHSTNSTIVQEIPDRSGSSTVLLIYYDGNLCIAIPK